MWPRRYFARATSKKLQTQRFETQRRSFVAEKNARTAKHWATRVISPCGHKLQRWRCISLVVKQIALTRTPEVEGSSRCTLHENRAARIITVAYFLHATVGMRARALSRRLRLLRMCE